METTTPIPTGFRRDIMVLHHLSELMEKNPGLPRPKITLNRNSSGQTANEIYWYISADRTITVPHRDEDGNWADWDERAAKIKELRRVDLEERMAALVQALGDDLEWEKNDPTVDTYSYRLTSTWLGCTVHISTWRSDVCEEVVVLETEREEEQPDPELHQVFLDSVPKVKVVVKDQIKEWQCNERLAAVTAPKHVRTVQVVS